MNVLQECNSSYIKKGLKCNETNKNFYIFEHLKLDVYDWIKKYNIKTAKNFIFHIVQ